MKRTSLLLTACLAVAGTACDSLRARQAANEAAGLYKKGDLKGAAEQYERAAAFDGNIAPIALNLGFTYLSIYQAAPKSKEGGEAGGKALAAFEKYITLKPSDERGRQYLLQTFVDTGRYDDAVTYFKPEIEKTPPSLEAIQTLGLIASKTQRLGAALNWYQRRCDLAPNDYDGHYNLGVLLWGHLHDHPEVTGDQRVMLADRGLAALHKAAELRPKAGDAFAYLNLLLRERAKGWISSLPPEMQAALAADACAQLPPPPPPDPKAVVDPAAKKVVDDANAKRLADCAEADKLKVVATDIYKATPPAPPASEKK